jgi:phage terminase large subunit-like protein
MDLARPGAAGTVSILIVAMAPEVGVTIVVHQFTAAQNNDPFAEGANGFLGRFF